MKKIKGILGIGVLMLGMVFTFNVKQANAAESSPLCTTYCEISFVYDCIITSPSSQTRCYFAKPQSMFPTLE